MRLWSLHPSLLDRQGLLAAWREGLLAQSVIARLENHEKPGWANHPQLKRFLASPIPLLLIGTWLTYIQEEASRRGYNFDKSKILNPERLFRIVVTSGQLNYEFKHLQSKLEERSDNDYQYNKCYYQHALPPAHPMFEVIPGDIESWEKVK